MHMGQLMPLSLASVRSRLVLVPAHPGNPRQRQEGRKTGVLCVCACPSQLKLILNLATPEGCNTGLT